MVNKIRSLLKRCRNERGVALLATMLAIALMTIIVVDFTSSSAMGYLSAANHANEIRAAYLARSAVNVGLALLAQDTRAQTAQSAASGGGGGTTATNQPVDSFASVWAIPFPPIPLNGGTVQLAVVDEARKFNINKLVIRAIPGVPLTPQQTTTSPNGVATPAAGTPVAGTPGAALPTPGVGQPDIDAINQFTRLVMMLGISPAIIPPIVDWLDPDSIESMGGAESDYYLGLDRKSVV
jgi:hypothetical protein